MQIITASIYYPPTSVPATASTSQYPTERIYYSEERYGCIENFEIGNTYRDYIEQTKNDLIAIAKFINLSEGFYDNIILFCNSLYCYQSFDFDLKKLVYTDLSQYLHSLKKLNCNHVSADVALIKKIIGEVFEKLTNDVRAVLTNIIYASSAIDSLSKKNISWHVSDRRLFVIESVLANHVVGYHKHIDDAKREQYINAYKHHLAVSKWTYSFLFKNKNAGRYVQFDTAPNFFTLLEKINQAVDIVSIIKDIGNMIRQRIEEILNEPGHHQDIEGMRYLSEPGHQAMIAFAQSSSPPIDLNTVLARNIANNCLFLLKDADAIYGALAEALAVENNKEILFHIKSMIIADRIKVKSFKDFFWVDYNGGFRGPLTVEALNLIGVQGAVNDDLLRFAIINTPSELLLENYCFNWCDNIYSVFDNFLESNMFALYKQYFIQGRVDVGRTDKNGNTFLHAAIFHNDNEAYDYVKNKLDAIINCTNKFGVTALMQAAVKGVTLMVLRLLECNSIDINVAENNGFTALGLAVKNHHKDVSILLRSHSITLNSGKRTSEHTDNAVLNVNQSGVYCLSD